MGRTAIVVTLVLAVEWSVPAARAECKDKHAYAVKRVTKYGQAHGALKHLRKKNGKRVSFDTTHFAYHRSVLTMRWPRGVKSAVFDGLILEVSAAKLPKPERWWFELRNFRKRKWIKLGDLSWTDGGGDKSYQLRKVDLRYYRDKRGDLSVRLRNTDVGQLRVDRLRLRLHCQ